jgi:hypothetical protein
LLLLPVASDVANPIALTGTAIDAWDAFARPTTLDEATASLAARFDGPSSVIAASLHDLVGELASIGALTPYG